MKLARKSWQNTTYFVLSAIGAAVGLGNIWKFPYAIGINGGGYFLLAYVISIFFCVLPILVAELAIGKYCKKNTIDAFKDLSKKFNLSKFWNCIPILGLATALLVLSFYSVVSGWSLYYLIISLTGELSNVTTEESVAIWTKFSSSAELVILCHTLFIFLTAWFVSRGINNGLEKLNIITMPILFIILFILIFYVAFENNDSFIKAIKFIFSFDSSGVAISDVLLSALGQAFFSLAVGVGAMIMYGSYLKEETRLLNSSYVIVFAQLIVGLLSSIAIFSVVFTTSSSKIAAGPELMFIVIPSIVSNMAYSQLMSLSFFIVLFIAALTSSVNIAELLIATLHEKTNLSRKKSSVIIAIIVWFIGSILSLSFNIFSDFLIFDKFNIFEFTIHVSTDYMLTIGGALIAIYAGWVLPKHLKMEVFTDENIFIAKTWVFLLKFVSSIIPVIILIFPSG